MITSLLQSRPIQIAVICAAVAFGTLTTVNTLNDAKHNDRIERVEAIQTAHLAEFLDRVSYLEANIDDHKTRLMHTELQHHALCVSIWGHTREFHIC